MKIKNFIILLALLYFSSYSDAFSLIPASCGCTFDCPATESQHGYEVGKIYTYQYESSALTRLIADESVSPSIKLKTKVTLRPTSQCEIELTLSESSFEVSKGSTVRQPTPQMRSMAKELELNKLSASIKDGRLEALCSPPSSAEPTWVLNVKRAILAHLQRSATPEIDSERAEDTIFGSSCEVRSRVRSRQEDQVQVERDVNSTSCSGAALSSIPFGEIITPLMGLNEQLQSMVNGQFNSRHLCVQSIALPSGRVTTVDCEESLRLTELAGARVTSKLSFTAESDSSAQRPTTVKQCANTRRTIQIETFSTVAAKERTPEQRTESAKALLRRVCRVKSKGALGLSEMPELFFEGSALIKTMNGDELAALFPELSTICRTGVDFLRRYLIDAIALLRSPAAVSAINSLVTSKELTRTELALLLDSIALIESPSREIMQAAAPLFDQLASSEALDLLSSPRSRTTITASKEARESIRAQAFLSTGALINKFCANPVTSRRCQRDPLVIKFAQELSRAFGKDCKGVRLFGAEEAGEAGARNMERSLLLAVKSAANAGPHNLAVGQDMLERCLVSNTSSIALQLAAIDAFRNVPCDSLLPKDRLLFTLSNPQSPIELRIAAHRTLTVCPNRKHLHYLRSLLDQGSDFDSPQLRAFVYTHLLSLVSSRPEWARQLSSQGIVLSSYENEFGAIFSSTVRTSRVQHLTVSPSASVSGTIGGHWIWNDAHSRAMDNDSSTYWPRAIGGQVEVTLFGKRFSLLEIGTRFTNVDALFESVFRDFMLNYLGGSGDGEGVSATQAKKLGEYATGQTPLSTNQNTEETDEIKRIEREMTGAEPTQPKQPKYVGADFSLKMFGYELRYDEFFYRITEDLLSQMARNWVSTEEEEVEKEQESDTTPVPPSDAEVPVQPTSNPQAAEILEDEDDQSQANANSKGTSKAKWWQSFKKLHSKLVRMAASVFKFRANKQIDLEWNKLFQLGQISYQLPSSFGLPLTVSANASTFVDLKLDANVDIRELNDFDISAHILPLMNTQLTGFMGFSFGEDSATAAERAGVQLKASIKTDLELDVQGNVKGLQLVKFNWNLPREKMSLFKISTNMSIIEPGVEATDEEDVEASAISQSEICLPSGDSTLSRMLGLQTCLAMRVPTLESDADETTSRSIARLLGTRIDLYLAKTDTHSGYSFEFSRNSEETSSTLKLWFDTPGATIRPRRLGIELKVDKIEKSMTGTLATPSKIYTVTGSMDLQPAISRAQFQVQSDTERLLSMSAQCVHSGSRNSSLFSMKPRIEIQYKDRRPFVVRAAVETAMNSSEDANSERRQVSLEFGLENFFKQPLVISLRGARSFKDQRKQYDLTAELSSSFISGRGTIVHKYLGTESEKSITSTADLEYNWPKRSKRTLSVSQTVALKALSEAQEKSMEWTAQVTNADGDRWSWNATTKRSTKFIISYMPESTSIFLKLSSPSSDVLDTSAQYEYSDDQNGKRIHLAADLKLPSYSISRAIEFSHSHGSNALSDSLSYRYSADVNPFKLALSLAKKDADSFDRATYPVQAATYILQSDPARYYIGEITVESESLLNGYFRTVTSKTDDRESLYEQEILLKEIGLHWKSELYVKGSLRSMGRRGWFSSSSDNSDLEIKYLTQGLNGLDSAPGQVGSLNLNELASNADFQKLEAKSRFDPNSEPFLAEVEIARNDQPLGKLAFKRTRVTRSSLPAAEAAREDFGVQGYKTEVEIFGKDIALFKVANEYRVSESSFLFNNSLEYSLPAYSLGSKVDFLIRKQIKISSYTDRQSSGEFYVRVDNLDMLGFEYTLGQLGQKFENSIVFTWSQRLLANIVNMLYTETGIEALEAFGPTPIPRLKRMINAVLLRGQGDDTKRLTLDTLFFYDDALLYKALNSSIQIRAPFENMEMLDARLNLLGQLTQVKIEGEALFGTLALPKRYRAEVWFRPFEIWQNTVGIRLITPHPLLSYVHLQAKYAITANLWQVAFTKQLDANKQSFLNFEWADRGTVSASESGSQSTVKRTSDWSIGIEFSRRFGEEVRTNYTLLLKHFADQKKVQTTIGGSYGPGRTLSSTTKVQVEDPSSSQPGFSFNLFDRSQTKSKVDGSFDAVLEWDNERHNADLRFSYFPSKKSTLTARGNFDTINMDFEALVNCPRLHTLPRTAKGSLVYTMAGDGNDATRPLSTTLNTDLSTNLPDYEKLGLLLSIEQSPNGTKLSADVQVPSKLKSTSTKRNTNPLKIVFSSRPVQNLERQSQSLQVLIPFTFSWVSSETRAIRQISAKNELDLQTIPYKANVELNYWYSGQNANKKVDLLFELEPPVAQSQLENILVPDSIQRSTLGRIWGMSVRAIQVKRVKIIVKPADVLDFAGFTLEHKNNGASKGFLAETKLETSDAVYTLNHSIQVGESDAWYLPMNISFNVKKDSEANATSMFLLDFTKQKFTLRSTSGDSRFRIEQNFDTRNIQGTGEITCAGTTAWQHQLMFRVFPNGRSTLKANITLFEKRLEAEAAYNDRQRSLNTRGSIWNAGQEIFSHNFKLEHAQGEHPSFDLVFVLTNKGLFDQSTFPGLEFRHLHFYSQSEIYDSEAPVQKYHIMQNTSIIFGNQILTMVETPCSVEMNNNGWILHCRHSHTSDILADSRRNFTLSAESKFDLFEKIIRMEVGGHVEFGIFSTSSFEKREKAVLSASHSWDEGHHTRVEVSTGGLCYEASGDGQSCQLAQFNLSATSDINAVYDDQIPIAKFNITLLALQQRVLQVTAKALISQNPFLVNLQSYMSTQTSDLGLNLNTTMPGTNSIQIGGSFKSPAWSSWAGLNGQIAFNLESGKFSIHLPETVCPKRSKIGFEYKVMTKSLIESTITVSREGEEDLKMMPTLEWQTRPSTDAAGQSYNVISNMTLSLRSLRADSQVGTGAFSLIIPESTVDATLKGKFDSEPLSFEQDLKFWPFSFQFTVDQERVRKTEGSLTVTKNNEAESLEVSGKFVAGKYTTNMDITLTSDVPIDMKLLLVCDPSETVECFKYNLKFQVLPEASITSDFSGQLPIDQVQHFARLHLKGAQGGDLTFSSSAFTISGSLSTALPEKPELDLTLVSSAELIGNTALKIEADQENPLTKFKIQFSNSYLSTKYATTENPDNTVLEIDANVKSVKWNLINISATGSVPVWPRVQNFNLSIASSIRNQALNLNASLIYGAEKEKYAVIEAQGTMDSSKNMPLVMFGIRTTDCPQFRNLRFSFTNSRLLTVQMNTTNQINTIQLIPRVVDSSADLELKLNLESFNMQPITIRFFNDGSIKWPGLYHSNSELRLRVRSGETEVFSVAYKLDPPKDISTDLTIFYIGLNTSWEYLGQVSFNMSSRLQVSAESIAGEDVNAFYVGSVNFSHNMLPECYLQVGMSENSDPIWQRINFFDQLKYEAKNSLEPYDQVNRANYRSILRLPGLIAFSLNRTEVMCQSMIMYAGCAMRYTFSLSINATTETSTPNMISLLFNNSALVDELPNLFKFSHSSESLGRNQFEFNFGHHTSTPEPLKAQLTLEKVPLSITLAYNQTGIWRPTGIEKSMHWLQVQYGQSSDPVDVDPPTIYAAIFADRSQKASQESTEGGFHFSTPAATFRDLSLTGRITQTALLYSHEWFIKHDLFEWPSGNLTIVSEKSKATLKVKIVSSNGNSLEETISLMKPEEEGLNCKEEFKVNLPLLGLFNHVGSVLVFENGTKLLQSKGENGDLLFVNVSGSCITEGKITARLLIAARDSQDELEYSFEATSALDRNITEMNLKSSLFSFELKTPDEGMLTTQFEISSCSLKDPTSPIYTSLTEEEIEEIDPVSWKSSKPCIDNSAKSGFRTSLVHDSLGTNEFLFTGDYSTNIGGQIILQLDACDWGKLDARYSIISKTSTISLPFNLTLSGMLNDVRPMWLIIEMRDDKYESKLTPQWTDYAVLQSLNTTLMLPLSGGESIESSILMIAAEKYLTHGFLLVQARGAHSSQGNFAANASFEINLSQPMPILPLNISAFVTTSWPTLKIAGLTSYWTYNARRNDFTNYTLWTTLENEALGENEFTSWVDTQNIEIGARLSASTTNFKTASALLHLSNALTAIPAVLLDLEMPNGDAIGWKQQTTLLRATLLNPNEGSIEIELPKKVNGFEKGLISIGFDDSVNYDLIQQGARWRTLNITFQFAPLLASQLSLTFNASYDTSKALISQYQFAANLSRKEGNLFESRYKFELTYQNDTTDEITGITLTGEKVARTEFEIKYPSAISSTRSLWRFISQANTPDNLVEQLESIVGKCQVMFSFDYPNTKEYRLLDINVKTTQMGTWKSYLTFSLNRDTSMNYSFYFGLENPTEDIDQAFYIITYSGRPGAWLRVFEQLKIGDKYDYAAAINFNGTSITGVRTIMIRLSRFNEWTFTDKSMTGLSSDMLRYTQSLISTNRYFKEFSWGVTYQNSDCKSPMCSRTPQIGFDVALNVPAWRLEKSFEVSSTLPYITSALPFTFAGDLIIDHQLFLRVNASAMNLVRQSAFLSSQSSYVRLQLVTASEVHDMLNLKLALSSAFEFEFAIGGQEYSGNLILRSRPTGVFAGWNTNVPGFEEFGIAIKLMPVEDRFEFSILLDAPKILEFQWTELEDTKFSLHVILTNAGDFVVPKPNATIHLVTPFRSLRLLKVSLQLDKPNLPLRSWESSFEIKHNYVLNLREELTLTPDSIKLKHICGRSGRSIEAMAEWSLSLPDIRRLLEIDEDAEEATGDNVLASLGLRLSTDESSSFTAKYLLKREIVPENGNERRSLVALVLHKNRLWSQENAQNAPQWLKNLNFSNIDFCANWTTKPRLYSLKITRDSSDVLGFDYAMVFNGAANMHAEFALVAPIEIFNDEPITEIRFRLNHDFNQSEAGKLNLLVDYMAKLLSKRLQLGLRSEIEIDQPSQAATIRSTVQLPAVTGLQTAGLTIGMGLRNTYFGRIGAKLTTSNNMNLVDFEMGASYTPGQNGFSFDVDFPTSEKLKIRSIRFSFQSAPTLKLIVSTGINPTVIGSHPSEKRSGLFSLELTQRPFLLSVKVENFEALERHFKELRITGDYQRSSNPTTGSIKKEIVLTRVRSDVTQSILSLRGQLAFEISPEADLSSWLKWTGDLTTTGNLTINSYFFKPQIYSLSKVQRRSLANGIVSRFAESNITINGITFKLLRDIQFAENLAFSNLLSNKFSKRFKEQVKKVLKAQYLIVTPFQILKRMEITGSTDPATSKYRTGVEVTSSAFSPSFSVNASFGIGSAEDPATFLALDGHIVCSNARPYIYSIEVSRENENYPKRFQVSLKMAADSENVEKEIASLLAIREDTALKTLEVNLPIESDHSQFKLELSFAPIEATKTGDILEGFNANLFFPRIPQKDYGASWYWLAAETSIQMQVQANIPFIDSSYSYRASFPTRFLPEFQQGSNDENSGWIEYETDLQKYVDLTFTIKSDIPVSFEFGRARGRDDETMPMITLEVKNEAKPLKFSTTVRLNQLVPRYDTFEVDLSGLHDYENPFTDEQEKMGFYIRATHKVDNHVNHTTGKVRILFPVGTDSLSSDRRNLLELSFESEMEAIRKKVSSELNLARVSPADFAIEFDDIPANTELKTFKFVTDTLDKSGAGKRAVSHELSIVTPWVQTDLASEIEVSANTQKWIGRMTRASATTEFTLSHTFTPTNRSHAILTRIAFPEGTTAPIELGIEGALLPPTDLTSILKGKITLLCTEQKSEEWVGTFRFGGSSNSANRYQNVTLETSLTQELSLVNLTWAVTLSMKPMIETFFRYKKNGTPREYKLKLEYKGRRTGKELLGFDLLNPDSAKNIRTEIAIGLPAPLGAWNGQGIEIEVNNNIGFKHTITTRFTLKASRPQMTLEVTHLRYDDQGIALDSKKGMTLFGEVRLTSMGTPGQQIFEVEIWSERQQPRDGELELDDNTLLVTRGKTTHMIAQLQQHLGKSTVAIKIHWKPRFIQALRKQFAEEHANISGMFSASIAATRNDLSTQFSSTSSSLRATIDTVSLTLKTSLITSFEEELLELFNFLNEVADLGEFGFNFAARLARLVEESASSFASLDWVQAVGRSLSSTSASITNSIRENLIYLNYQVDIARRAITPLWLEALLTGDRDALDYALDGALSTAQDIFAAIYERFDAFLYAIENRMWESIEEQLNVWIARGVDLAADGFDRVTYIVADFVVNLARIVHRITLTIVSQSASLIQNASGTTFTSSQLKPFIDVAQDLIDKRTEQVNALLLDMPDNEYLLTARNFLVYANQTLNDWRVQLSDAEEQAAASFDEMKADIQDEVLQAVSDRVRTGVAGALSLIRIFLFEYSDLEARLRSVVRENYALIMRDLREEIKESVATVKNARAISKALEEVRVRRKFGLDQGVIELEIVAPVRFDSFNGLLTQEGETADRWVESIKKSVLNINFESVQSALRAVLFDGENLLRVMDRLYQRYLIAPYVRIAEGFSTELYSFKTGNPITYFKKFMHPRMNPVVAAIYSRGHLTTFDGRHYSINERSDSDCKSQYLLAHHIDANGKGSRLSVVLKTEVKSRKSKVSSVVVLAESGQFRIEVNKSNSLEVNAQRVDLPFLYVIAPQNQTLSQKWFALTIERLRSAYIVRLPTYGAEVRIDLRSQTVELRFNRALRTYESRMIGLFGQLDHDPSNDLFQVPVANTQANGQVAKQWILKGDFLDAFRLEVNSKCPSFEVGSEHAIDDDWQDADILDTNKQVDLGEEDTELLSAKAKPSHKKLCQYFFESHDSPFRNCFQKVAPKDYLRTCLSDPKMMNEGENKDANGTAQFCHTASIYSKQCALKQVKIKVPQLCQKCTSAATQQQLNVGDRTEISDQSQILTVLGRSTSTRSARIVILVDESTCLKDKLLPQGSRDNLAALFAQVSTSYATKNIRNIEYSVLGFNGLSFVDEEARGFDEGGWSLFSRPHIHSTSDSLWTDSNKAILAIQHAHFTAEKVRRSWRSRPEMATLASAIQFAILHLKSGASTPELNLVLATCSDSTSLSGEKYRLWRSYLQEELASSAIRMHLLSLWSPKVQSALSSIQAGTQPDGFSNKALFESETTTLIRAAQWTPAVESKLANTLPSALAIRSGGAVFSLNSFADPTNTNFAQNFGTQLANSEASLTALPGFSRIASLSSVTCVQCECRSSEPIRFDERSSPLEDLDRSGEVFPEIKCTPCTTSAR